MSEFHVRVVQVGPIEKHPNADTLSITEIDGGYPVIIRTGEFKEGDRAVYIPVDSIVPDTEQWAFLKGNRRIKAKKLRGVFSMGMLASIPPDPVGGMGFGGFKIPREVGDNVQELMGIEKYEPHIHNSGGPNACKMGGNGLPQPEWFHQYTDIEGYRKNKNLFVPGEEVILTEKVHGSSFRACFKDSQLWVGSHHRVLAENDSVFWIVAKQIEPFLRATEGIVWYGEVYGPIQKGFRYDTDGTKAGLKVRMFDAKDSVMGRYLDYDEFEQILGKQWDLWDLQPPEMCPVLYRGPWSPDLVALAEGQTTLGGTHVREGWVGRPVKERWDHRVGRVILKCVGEGYLLSKDS